MSQFDAVQVVEFNAGNPIEAARLVKQVMSHPQAFAGPTVCTYMLYVGFLSGVFLYSGFAQQNVKEPGAGEVQVTMKLAGVNPSDGMYCTAESMPLRVQCAQPVMGGAMRICMISVVVYVCCGYCFAAPQCAEMITAACLRFSASWVSILVLQPIYLESLDLMVSITCRLVLYVQFQSPLS